MKIANANVVIYVDDSEADQELAATCYQRSKLTNAFVTMKSGPDLLAHLDRVESLEVPMPAMVLVDISMPAMDGFELIEAIRRRPRFASMPVVVMSTSDEVQDQERATELGAQGYAIKPLDPKSYISFFDSLAT